MARKVIGIIGIVFLAFATASCSVRSYVQDKSRVDQEMRGNAGCLQGSCESVDRSDVKKTRKTYVLEFTKNPKNAGIQEGDTNEFYSKECDNVNSSDGSLDKQKSVVIYDAQQEMIQEPEVVYVDYEIQEGDTLQKISKKFYDTYKRWYEIYEINKDMLPNPDRIKPGKVIKVPQSK